MDGSTSARKHAHNKSKSFAISTMCLYLIQFLMRHFLIYAYFGPMRRITGALLTYFHV